MSMCLKKTLSFHISTEMAKYNISNKSSIEFFIESNRKPEIYWKDIKSHTKSLGVLKVILGKQLELRATIHYDISGGSDGKESACSTGDPGSIPGSGRSPGEGNGNPLQYSCLRIPWTEGPGRL